MRRLRKVFVPYVLRRAQKADERQRTLRKRQPTRASSVQGPAPRG